MINYSRYHYSSLFKCQIKDLEIDFKIMDLEKAKFIYNKYGALVVRGLNK